MELRQLRYFTTVATEQNISRAALLLGVSQPALTRQIQFLENELGVPLLHRTGHGVTLTEAGETFLGLVSQLVAEAEGIVHQMQAMRAVPSGKVTVSIPPMIGDHLIAPLLKRVMRDYPSMTVQTKVGISGYSLEWLTTGIVDVAVLYSADQVPSLTTEPLLTDDLCFIAPSALNDQIPAGPFSFAKATTYPLVLPCRQHGLRAIVDAAAAKCSIALRTVIEVDAMTPLVDLVEEGVGCTFLPFGAVRRRIDHGKLTIRPVVEPVLRGTLSLAFSPTKPTSAAMRVLFTCIREEAQRLRRDGIWPASFE